MQMGNIVWNYQNLYISNEIITLSWTKPSECGDTFNSVIVMQLPGSGTNRSTLGNLTNIDISRDNVHFDSNIILFIEMEVDSVICAVSLTSLQIPTQGKLNFNDFGIYKYF